MSTKILFPLKRFFKNKILSLIWAAAPIVISYFFSLNELRTFLIFAILIPVFTFNKYDGRILIGYAILLLMFASILIFTKEESYTEQLAIFSFWLLVVGICCLLIESFRKNDWMIVMILIEMHCNLVVIVANSFLCYVLSIENYYICL